jgi:CubicO group peptidase (beta-lactamase class C family)
MLLHIAMPNKKQFGGNTMARRGISAALLFAVLTLAGAMPVAAFARQATPAACPTATVTIPIASPVAAGSPTAAGTLASIDQQLLTQAEMGTFSGTVLVARAGRILLESGYGLADRACGVTNTPETTFRIGSITKQFTAAAILLLEQDGKLDVDAPVTDYLPDFPRREGDGVPITIHHLLSHTSGMPELFAIYGEVEQADLPATPHDLVYSIANDHELDFTPGTAHSYSNTGYLLLGLIIEAAAGQPYESYLHERIFQPAGMSMTGFEAAGDERPNPALGYHGSGVTDISAVTRLDIAWSAGGMFSTVGDLHRWHLALNDGTVLDPELVARMETPVLDDYGYGLFMLDIEGHRFVGHNGGIEGFVAVAGRFPESDLDVVILSNQDNGHVAFNSVLLNPELMGQFGSSIRSAAGAGDEGDEAATRLPRHVVRESDPAFAGVGHRAHVSGAALVFLAVERE